MSRILKHDLKHVDAQDISLPHTSEILDVQFKNGALQLWFIDNNPTDYAVKRVTIRIFSTGERITSNNKLVHISTIQGGCFVWHIFEEVK